MYLSILSKLISESLLSLYPVFVKLINISLELQLWSRFVTYVLLSAFFVNWSFIRSTIVTKNGILLALITILHVFFSYKGFQLLESGVAYTLFYTYPIMILLMSKNKINPLYLLTLIGVFLLSQKKETKKETFSEKDSREKKRENVSEEQGGEVQTNKQTHNKTKHFKKNGTSELKESFKYEGLVMIVLAAFTEALIYFIVRNIKTKNNWNHLFISYGLGAILLSIYLWKEIRNTTIHNTLSISMVINSVIGLLGYVLRFYATTRLPTTLYSSLSYFGIVMSYVYGIILNSDVLSFQKILGTLFIIFPNLWLYVFKK